MIYYLASIFQQYFGPLRLFQSTTVLIIVGLFTAFLCTMIFLPRFFPKLPRDRGKEFSVGGAASAGKPTGAGVVFITLYVIVLLLLTPMNNSQLAVLLLTWIVMLTGYLDDKSVTPWGELKKGLLDFVLSLITAFVLYYMREPIFWVPFISKTFTIHPALFISITTVILWISINTTNCTDGVDGLSGTLVLVALISMGTLFYFVQGHREISQYLLVPHMRDGAQWGIMTFTLSGCLMAYLWYNAYPSRVLMGDAGSRALGFFLGVAVMVSGNPFLLIMTSTMILVNGGTGLVKVALLRFFKIRIFSNVQFPLHDHMRKKRNWSPTQVLIKFTIMQILISLATIGIFFKIR